MAVLDVREGAAWTRPQRWKNDVIYVAACIGLAVARAMPRAVVRGACALIALAAYALLRRTREGVVVRARRAGLADPRAFARRAFFELGRMLADTLALLDPEEPARRGLELDEESRRVFAEAITEGRGVVFVSAHLGPWERLAAVLAAEGFPVATVARESYDPRFTNVYDRLRGPRGVRSIYRGRPRAALHIARELVAGRAVGFLVDLPSRGAPSIEVELLGAPMRMPLGAARLAIARGAAVLVGTPARAPSGRKVIRITRVRAKTAGGLDGLTPAPSECELVHAIATELDARIRAWPEAWLGLFTPERVREADRENLRAATPSDAIPPPRRNKRLPLTPDRSYS